MSRLAVASLWSAVVLGCGTPPVVAPAGAGGGGAGGRGAATRAVASEAPGAGALPSARPRELPVPLAGGGAFAALEGDSRGLASADVDGDGRLDVYVCNFRQPNALFLNAGGGRLQRAEGGAATAGEGRSFGAAFGDVDGDGRPDLFVANTDDEPNALLLNASGPGGVDFAVAPTGPVTSDRRDSYAGAFDDVDADGDLDLLVVNRHQPNDLYLNDGRARFRRAGDDPFTAGASASRDLALGDLDGDGDRDVVVANSNDQPSGVFVNQGGVQGGRPGAYEALRADPIVLHMDRTSACDVGDVDGDGDLDVALVARRGGRGALFLNRGDGTFAAVADAPLSQRTANAQACALADVDGDGRLDLYVANRGEPSFLFLNAGEGRLQPAREGPLLDRALELTDVALLPLGDDGALDFLATAAQGGNHHLRLPRAPAPPTAPPTAVAGEGAPRGPDPAGAGGDAR